MRVVVFAVAGLALGTAACNRTDAVVSPEPPESRSATQEITPKSLTMSREANREGGSTASDELALYIAKREQAAKEFSNVSAALTLEMIADIKANPMAYNPNADDRSRVAQCEIAKRAIAKYSPRLFELTNASGFPTSRETFDLTINSSVCRSGGSMSIFGLAPGMLLQPPPLADDGLTQEQIEEIDRMIGDSLTEAGYNDLARIDLSSVTYGSLTELDAALASVTGTGTSLDNEILWMAKRELRNQYRTAWAVDWPGEHAPYMIFDPYFGWRWPTKEELWGYIGSACTGAVTFAAPQIRAAAVAGARAGAMAGGQYALLGAFSGALVGAGGRALTACATGAVGGGAALVGLLSTN